MGLPVYSGIFSGKTEILFNNLRAPAAMARRNLSTVAKNVNSTEHFVNLNTDCT